MVDIYSDGGHRVYIIVKIIIIIVPVQQHQAI